MIQFHSSQGSKTPRPVPSPLTNPPHPKSKRRFLNSHHASPSSLAQTKPHEPLGIPQMTVRGTHTLSSLLVL